MRHTLFDHRQVRSRGTWRSLDGTNGLPGPVLCFCQDRGGYLWMGTWGCGVAIYDGNTVSTLGTDDGLAGDRVWAVSEDDHGRKWIGTNSGLSCWDGAAFLPIKMEEELAGIDVNDLLVGQNGHLWVAHQAGLAVFDDDEGLRAVHVPELPEGELLSLAEDGDGGLWIGSAGGVARIHDGQVEHWTRAEEDALNEVEAVLVDRRGRVWLGTDDGLVMREGDTWRRFGVSDGLSHEIIRALTEGRDGRIWIATMGGVSCLEEDVFMTFGIDDGLVNNQITDVFEDAAGDMWFGSFGGVSQYSQSFTTITAEDGLAGNDMRAIMRAADGQMWFGTLGGLTRYDGETLTSFDAADGLPHHRVFAVLEDRDQRLWVGTETGLALREGDRFGAITTADGLIDNRVYCLFEDAAGGLWLGTEAGVSRRDPATGAFRNWTTADGLAGDDTNAICQDLAGRIWIGSEEGLTCWDGHTFTTYTAEQGGLPSSHVQSVVVDGEGTVWVATTEGLWSLKEGNVRVYTTADGLASDQVLRLMIDGTGYLWLATWGGVNRFDGEVFQTLTAEDGLATHVVMAMHHDADGTIWFGTVGGLTLFQQPQPTPPPVAVQAVVADRRYEDLAEGVVVPASAGLTAIEFSSVNFKTRPGSMVHRYRLQGFDKQWRTTHERRVEYVDLPPRQYTFQVIAVDRDLNYSMPASLTLTVAPDTRDEKIDELEQRVQERTHELQERNRALEETLTELRQTQNQMIVQEKMAALGNLVAGIAHELNTPLGTVKSAADVSARGLARIRDVLAGGKSIDAAHGGQTLERVLKALGDNSQATTSAIKRLTRIVDSLKTFTHLDRAEFERVDVHEGLDSALTLMEPRFGAKVEIVRDYGELPPLNCYPQELNQLYMSLLLNACQAFEDDGGRVRVSTRAEEGYVSIVIADDGPGIPAERLARIFEPSFATKDGRVAMGMGLALSYNIVRKHAGTLDIDSEPGRGTTVTIRLPTTGLQRRGPPPVRGATVRTGGEARES